MDRRKLVDSFFRTVLDEAIPGGASLAYVFGSGLLYLLLSQVITGMFLVLYYVPSADHAHTTVAYITKEVTSGSFIRQHSRLWFKRDCHRLATARYSKLFLRIVQGTAKTTLARWMRVICLDAGMSFTGYLLPWDQKAYFCHNGGYEYPDLCSIRGEFTQELATRRDGDGHIDTFPLLRPSTCS